MVIFAVIIVPLLLVAVVASTVVWIHRRHQATELKRDPLAPDDLITGDEDPLTIHLLPAQPCLRWTDKDDWLLRRYLNDHTTP